MTQLVQFAVRLVARLWGQAGLLNLDDDPRPTRDPRAHASGTESEHILLFGSELAVGWGAASHKVDSGPNELSSINSGMGSWQLNGSHLIRGSASLPDCWRWPMRSAPWIGRCRWTRRSTAPTSTRRPCPASQGDLSNYTNLRLEPPDHAIRIMRGYEPGSLAPEASWHDRPRHPRPMVATPTLTSERWTVL
jgi:hypothetical protein